METPILEQIYFIGQTISAIAVVLSLVYVGLQIRQNTKATRMSAAHSFLDTQNAYVGLISQSGALADILGRGADGLSNLQRSEVIQFSAFHDQAFSSFQTFFTEWKDGMLDDRLWGLTSTLWPILGATLEYRHGGPTENTGTTLLFRHMLRKRHLRG